MAGGAGVSGTGVGGISVGGSAGWAGTAEAGGNEVTDTLQALNISVKAIKAYFNFIQEDSFQDIQTIPSPESSIQLSKINIAVPEFTKPA
jgi:hypothetical protein